MATSLHDVLRGMLEDVQRYEVLAKRANGDLSGRPVARPDDELVSGALKEIERLSYSQARARPRGFSPSEPPSRSLEELMEARQEKFALGLFSEIRIKDPG